MGIINFSGASLLSMPNHHTLQGTGKAKMFNHTSTMPEMGGTVEEDGRITPDKFDVAFPEDLPVPHAAPEDPMSSLHCKEQVDEALQLPQ